MQNSSKKHLYPESFWSGVWQIEFLTKTEQIPTAMAFA